MADSNTIGKASLKLTADGTQLSKQLDSISGKITNFSKNIVKKIALGSAIGGLFQNLLGNATSQISEFLSSVKTELKQAEGLGVDFSQFQVISAVAGGSDRATTALSRLSRSVGEARLGNSQAASSFNLIGVSMEQLAGLTPDQQLRRVAEGMAQIQDPTMRTTVGFQLFGRQYAELSPLLAQGSAGLDRARARLEGFGLAMSQADAEKLKSASKAMSDIGLSIKGLFTRIAVAVAPLIEVWAKIQTSILTALRPAFDWIAQAFSVVGEVAMAAWTEIQNGMGAVREFFRPLIADIQGLGINFSDVRGTTLTVLEGISRALATVGDVVMLIGGYVIRYISIPFLRMQSTIINGFSRLFALAGRLPGAMGRIGRELSVAARGLSRGIDTALPHAQRLADGMTNIQVGQSSDAVGRFFQRIRDGATQTQAHVAQNNPIDPIRQALLGDISTLNDRLNQEIATFGMSSNAVERYRLALRGASEADLALTDRLIARREAMDLIREMQSPFERWETELGRLDNLFQRGALTYNQYAMAVQRASGQLAQAQEREIKLPSLQLRGSREAYQTIVRAQLQREQNNPQNMLVRLQQANNLIQQEQLQNAREILRVLNRPNPTPEVI